MASKAVEDTFLCPRFSTGILWVLLVMVDVAPLQPLAVSGTGCADGVLDGAEPKAMSK